ncbi:MAG: SUMF1/EgtB/PvdO family nonheme iron enzyme [Deltaproteobacteria bacterium]|nr:SUMF1/EgtB/PvdO family nonheme iron enzyme [Deltaproteobacteria bacterium]
MNTTPKKIKIKTLIILFLALYFSVVYATTATSKCIKGDCANGQGKYTYPDGSVYVGQWENDKFNGQGTFTYSDGSVYTGQWKNGQRNGQGTFTRLSGSKYQGRWKNDKFDGQGIYIYRDNSKYIGQWKNNMRNGPGTYTSSSGAKYQGQWKNGKLIGKGILITSDGNKFVGQFNKDGKLIGRYIPLVKTKAREKTETKKTARVKTDTKTTAVPGKKILTGPNGMKFVYIAPGNFMMGSPEGEGGRYDNEMQHQVTLTHGFYMQITEVTQGQWKALMEDNPSFFNGCGNDCPVEQVSWNDAQQFIWRLNQLEGAKKYRLPTEAEWEYVCRAGSTTAFSSEGITELECSHNSNLTDIAWFCGNSAKTTHPVAQKKANAWGLYDMHGNVSELCRNWYGEYPPNQITNPPGPASGIDRIVRGGGWNDHGRHCRSACRGAISSGQSIYNMGFRLVRMP